MYRGDIMNGEWGDTFGPDFEYVYKEGLKEEERLFQEKFKQTIKITPIAIEKIPYINYPLLNVAQNIAIQTIARKLLTLSHEDNDDREVAITVALDDKATINDDTMSIVLGSLHEVDILSDTKSYHLINTASNLVVVNLHNHPNNSNFSVNDISFFLRQENIKMLVLISNKGNIYFLSRSPDYNFSKAALYLQKAVRVVAKNRLGNHNELDPSKLSIKEKVAIAKIWLNNTKKLGIIYGDAKKSLTRSKGGR